LSSALTPALFIIAGLSAAEAAFYLSQNARSLIHCYRMQQRRIVRWFENMRASMTTERASKNEIRALILEFEDLMVEELIDWYQISGHDVLELAPSGGNIRIGRALRRIGWANSSTSERSRSVRHMTPGLPSTINVSNRGPLCTSLSSNFVSANTKPRRAAPPNHVTHLASHNTEDETGASA